MVHVPLFSVSLRYNKTLVSAYLQTDSCSRARHPLRIGCRAPLVRYIMLTWRFGGGNADDDEDDDDDDECE